MLISALHIESTYTTFAEFRAANKPTKVDFFLVFISSDRKGILNKITTIQRSYNAYFFISGDLKTNEI